jgi:2-polyprenyl-3-methyl-5-hydroxy-6-metoxy-1,4-benzoquinol methylase
MQTLRTGFIGGRLAAAILRLTNPSKASHCTGAAYRTRSKIDALLGDDAWSHIKGKTVVDFGCGTGGDSVEMARRGAARVIGVDNRQKVLDEAIDKARRAGVGDRCVFTRELRLQADTVVSLDGFEHYGDPAACLRLMHGMLRPGGRLLLAFGPTWFHPLGGHGFSAFPWAHVLLTEKSLLKWREEPATRFEDTDGGLNQMTVRRFKKLVAGSDFAVVRFGAIPIRQLRWLANPMTREFTTACVRCELVPKHAYDAKQVRIADLRADRYGTQLSLNAELQT